MGIGPYLQQVKYLLPLSVVHALFTSMFVNNTLSLGHYRSNYSVLNFFTKSILERIRLSREENRESQKLLRCNGYTPGVGHEGVLRIFPAKK